LIFDDLIIFLETNGNRNSSVIFHHHAFQRYYHHHNTHPRIQSFSLAQDQKKKSSVIFTYLIPKSINESIRCVMD
jgi:hypothetical protein